MKIGIMSMQRVKNYGSFLQAYALKATLKSIGFTSDFVDYTPETPIIKNDSQSIRFKIRHVLSNVKKMIISFVENVYFRIACEKRVLNSKKTKQTFDDFFEKNSYPLLGLSKDFNIRPELDVLIIGSDEVFNCLQGEPVGYSKELFGKNNRATTLISYAASFGYTSYEKLKQYNIADEINQMLSKFDYISVRDKNSKDIIETMGLSPEVHLDPVFIYDFQKEIIEPKTDKYLIVYGYTTGFTFKQKKAILKYAQKNNLKIICVGCYQNFCDEYVFASPFEVLGYFKNAECIITSTFHGTVMSIKYNKPFVTVVKQYNSQKLTSLLNYFNLSNRLLLNADDIENILKTDIDYEPINSIIENEKDRTLNYLKESCSYSVKRKEEQ